MKDPHQFDGGLFMKLKKTQERIVQINKDDHFGELLAIQKRND